MYSMGTTGNNTVLYTQKFLRVDLECSHHAHKGIRRGHGCVN